MRKLPIDGAVNGSVPVPQFTPQPGRQFDPAFDHPSCLCIFDRSVGTPVSQIPLSEDEFYGVLQTCSDQGIEPEQFIARAIRAGTAAAQTNNAQLDDMVRAVDRLPAVLDKYQVLAVALIDRLDGAELGFCPVMGYHHLATELNESARSAYGDIVKAWKAISLAIPGRSKVAALFQVQPS